MARSAAGEWSHFTFPWLAQRKLLVTVSLFVPSVVGSPKTYYFYSNQRDNSTYCHSSSSILGQILPVIRLAWKTVAEMAENRDLGRGPPNITSSGSLEMVGLGTLI